MKIIYVPYEKRKDDDVEQMAIEARKALEPLAWVIPESVRVNADEASIELRVRRTFFDAAALREALDGAKLGFRRPRKKEWDIQVGLP